jgi:hypothetical protein
LENEEDGRIYEFTFLTGSEYKKDTNKWFKVSEIYGLSDDFEFNKYLDSKKLKENEFSYRSLSTLKNVIHSRHLINFFLETEQNIDKALNIFIRINSGGEPLNFADLLMSIAVANWTEKDARKEINDLVDEIRDKGYFISRDFILKTFLVLHSKDIKFKVTNFSTENAKMFEEKWSSIRNAIHSAFDLIRSFGFTESTLTSKNAIIPIIYYLYHSDKYTDFDKLKQYEADRIVIRRWLHVVLIKRIFGGNADAVQTRIRNVIEENIGKDMLFPYQEISEGLRGTTKNMRMDEEFLENLFYTQKDDRYAFSILALLYPDLDYKNNNFHKDHIHPDSWFNEEALKEHNIPVEKYSFYLDPKFNNSILNLQLLDANENMSKQDCSLIDWIDSIVKNTSTKDIDRVCQTRMLPKQYLEFNQFEEFIHDRIEILQGKIAHLAN